MSPRHSFIQSRPILLAVAVGVALFSASHRTAAAVKTWDGDDATANPNWTDGVNWDNNVAPTAGDSLVFAGTAGLAPVNDYSAATAFSGISFAANAGAFTLSGANAINLTGDIVNSSSLLQTITAIPLALQQSINVNAAGNIAVSSVISGTGFGLTKVGAGSLTLSAANTYDGGTSINAGTLTLASNNAAAGTGAITFNGGNLAFSDGRTITNPIVVTSNAAVFAATSNNNNQLSGAITGSGTLVFNIAAAATQTFTLGANTNTVANFTGTIDLGTSTGILRFNSGGSSIGFGSSSMTINLGTASAVLRLRNGTSSTGTSSLTIGALTGGPNTSIVPGSSTGGVTTYIIGGLNTNTTFDGFIRNIASTATLNIGSSVGTVGINKVGSGSLTLTNTGNTYNGPTTVGTATVPGGTLVAQGDGTLGNSPTITINVGSRLTLTGGVTNNYINDFANVTLAATDGTNGNGIINLNFTGVPDSIGSLTVNGVLLNPGTYTASSPETTGYLFGTGALTVVPEPSTWATVLGGLGCLMIARRSRRQKQAA